MLWFYLSLCLQAKAKGQFQYISCYGSINREPFSERGESQFQYISCYGSMRVRHDTFGTLTTFQYISCYGSMSLLGT